jgi:hypothetical protein
MQPDLVVEFRATWCAEEVDAVLAVKFNFGDLMI